MIHIWSENGKYASEAGICKCWRKAVILDDALFVSEKSQDIVMDDEKGEDDKEELICALKKVFNLSANKSGSVKSDMENNDALADVADDFKDLQQLNNDDLNDLVHNWCNIEDNSDILTVKLMKHLRRLKRES